MTRNSVLLLLIISIMLSSCQLARTDAVIEDPKETMTNDRITGILVTTESLQKPQESTAIHAIENKGQRLYADLVEEEPYQRADGTVRKSFAYEFTDGLSLIGYRVSQEMLDSEEPVEEYWTNSISDELVPVKNLYHTGNEESFVQLEAEIHVADTAENLVLYMNPVFQTESGELYALGTAPMGYHAVSMYDCSVTYSQEQTEAISGNVVNEKDGYAKMTIKVVHLPDKYRIFHMSAENQILEVNEFKPQELPKEMTPLGNCDYILLEEISGKETVARTVYSPDDSQQFLDVLYPLENGICHKNYTKIQWEGEG